MVFYSLSFTHYSNKNYFKIGKQFNIFLGHFLYLHLIFKVVEIISQLFIITANRNISLIFNMIEKWCDIRDKKKSWFLVRFDPFYFQNDISNVMISAVWTVAEYKNVPSGNRYTFVKKEKKNYTSKMHVTRFPAVYDEIIYSVTGKINKE